MTNEPTDTSSGGRRQDSLATAFDQLKTDSQGLDTMEPLRDTTSRHRRRQPLPRLAFLTFAALAVLGVGGWFVGNTLSSDGPDVAATAADEEAVDGDAADRDTDEEAGTTDDGEPVSLDADALVDSSWTLVAGGGPDGPVPMVDGWPITLTFSEGNLGGTAACNGYGSNYSLDGNQIFLDGIGQNEMGCGDEIRESEQTYLAALADVNEINLVGDELALGGPSTELIFRRNDPVAAGELIGTLWQLESYVFDGATIAVAGDPATLLVNADGTFSGSTGCRGFSGRYQIFGNSVQFNEFGADGTTCPDSLWRQDGQVFGVLGDGFTTEIGDGRLIATSSGNEQLHYRAITEDELAEIPTVPVQSDAELLSRSIWAFVAGYDDVDNPGEVTMVDPESITPGQLITLIFDGEGGFSGDVICNSYGGSVEIGSGSFVFDPAIFSTRVGCPPEFNDLIERYGRALPLMTEFGVEADGTRLVMNGSDIELHFVRLER